MSQDQVVMIMRHSDLSRDRFMLHGRLARKGYDLWRHYFTAISKRNRRMCPFFIEFYILNPAVSPDRMQFAQQDQIPSYTMINAGCWGNSPLQLRDFFTINETRISPDKLEIEAGRNYLSETLSFGEISGDHTGAILSTYPTADILNGTSGSKKLFPSVPAIAHRSSSECPIFSE